MRNKYDSRTGHARVKVKPVSVRERMQALNPNKQTCIGKEADVSPQTKQTNLYWCRSEEVAFTLAKKFGTKFVIDRQKTEGQTDSGVHRHALACKNHPYCT